MAGPDSEPRQSRLSRRRTLKAGGGAFTAATVSIAGCQGFLGGGETELTYANPNEPGTVMSQFATQYAETVNERADSLTLDLHNGFELGNTIEQLEGVSTGSIDMNNYAWSFIPIFGEVPDIGALETPFVYDGFEAALDATDPVDSDVAAEFNEKAIEETSIRTIDTFTIGHRDVTLNQRATHPDDLAGVNVRAAGTEVFQAQVAGLGAEPTSIDWSETPQALATGSIDGVEQILSTLALESITEHQSHLLVTDHIPYPMCVGINEEVWQGLSDDQQAVLRDVAVEVSDSHWRDVRDGEADLKAEMGDRGLEIVDEDSGLDREAFRENSLSNWQETFPNFEPYIDRLQSM